MLLSVASASLLVLPAGLKLLRDIIGLIILWILISIPVYFAAKVVAGGRATFLQAMIVTLVGPIVFTFVLGLGYVITSKIPTGLGLLALVLALLAWLAVFKVSFGVGWIQAFGIAILAFIISVVLIAILEALGFMIKGVLLSHMAALLSLIH